MNDTVNTPPAAEDIPPAEDTPTPEVITNWYDLLPEDVRTWDEVKNSPDSDTFFKQMGDMRSMIGRSVQVPGPDASAEARQKYLEKVLEKTPEVMVRPSDDNMDEVYNSLGRPETHEKYEVPPMGDEVYIDNDSVNAFRPIAHKAGLSQKQFAEIVQEMTNNTNERSSQAMQEHQETMKELQKEWGAAYDQNLRIADKFRQDHFNHIQVPISEMGAADIRSMFTAGKAMLGEGVELTQEGGAQAIMTPAEAEHTINEIMSNREHAYWNQNHPNHKAAVQRIIELQKLKRGQVA